MYSGDGGPLVGSLFRRLRVSPALPSTLLQVPKVKAKRPELARSRKRDAMADVKDSPSGSWSISFSTGEPAPRRWRRRGRRRGIARGTPRFQRERKRRPRRHPAVRRRQRRRSTLPPLLAVAAAPTKRRDATSTGQEQATPGGEPSDRRAANGPAREREACLVARFPGAATTPRAAGGAAKIPTPTTSATAGPTRRRSADNAAVPRERPIVALALARLRGAGRA